MPRRGVRRMVEVIFVWDEGQLLASGVIWLKEAGKVGPGAMSTHSFSKNSSLKDCSFFCKSSLGCCSEPTFLLLQDAPRVAVRGHVVHSYEGASRPLINLDFDTDEDSRVLLLVHDTKPPFLEGK
eukprot:scaffold82437_cov12-Tisochrysis_lutea.AAC.1